MPSPKPPALALALTAALPLTLPLTLTPTLSLAHQVAAGNYDVITANAVKVIGNVKAALA